MASSSTLVNPVMAGSAVGLACMLLVSVCVDPSYGGLELVLGGIGQGTFTGMAAETRLGSWVARVVTGLLGGSLLVGLQGFFNGFGGKQGFTAMLSSLPVLAAQHLCICVPAKLAHVDRASATTGTAATTDREQRA